MKKNCLILFLFLLVLIFSFGCKKKVKREWHEVGAATPSVFDGKYGVRTDKGADMFPEDIFVANIYYPTGRDDNGVSTFKKIEYEMNELTPENIANAIADLEIVTPDTLFCDLQITDTTPDNVQELGPGGVGKKLTKEGLVRYVDEVDGVVFDSNLVNSDDYEGKSGKDLKGMINGDDILTAICNTFQENFQLVSCDYQPANMKDYNEVQAKKEKEAKKNANGTNEVNE